MDTLLTTINPFFARYEWNLQQNESAANQICYKKTNPYDEFVIAMLPQTREISVIVPIDSVPYKQKFQNMATVVEYINMHLDYYQQRTKM